MRLTAILLAADAIVGQTTASFFPVPQRGATGNSVMHAAAELQLCIRACGETLQLQAATFAVLCVLPSPPGRSPVWRVEFRN